MRIARPFALHRIASRLFVSGSCYPKSWLKYAQNSDFTKTQNRLRPFCERHGRIFAEPKKRPSFFAEQPMCIHTISYAQYSYTGRLNKKNPNFVLSPKITLRFDARILLPILHYFGEKNESATVKNKRKITRTKGERIFGVEYFLRHPCISALHQTNFLVIIQ